MIEEYKLESDSVRMFIAELNYQPSLTETVSVSVFYSEYKGFCLENGYRALGKKNFTKRCREAGFQIAKQSGYVVYAERRFY